MDKDTEKASKKIANYDLRFRVKNTDILYGGQLV